MADSGRAIWLDELVIEVAMEAASAANNGGEKSQIEWLLTNGWSAEDIERSWVEYALREEVINA